MTPSDTAAALAPCPGDTPAPSAPLALRDVPVVFLSYDEPWADAFWDDLRAKAPHALRVHGVKGLDACHKAAAQAAGTDWFLTVDADTLVDADFFDQTVPAEYISHTSRVDWASKSAVNGLVYGNGSLKLWPHRMVMTMRTHEAAPKTRLSVDHDIGAPRSGTHRIQMPGCFSVTRPAETAFHAFRCGLREGVRLAMPAGSRPTDGKPDAPARDLGGQIGPWRSHYLRVWCTLGSHTPHGAWVIYGARLGLWMVRASDWTPRHINDYGWLDAYWSQMVLPRFSPGGSRCPYTGTTWDAERLAAESTALARRIADHYDFSLPDIPPEASRLLVASQKPAFSPDLVDAMGYKYLKGLGVERDDALAREMFETGVLLNLRGSWNNLARMHERRLMPDADLATARRLYRVAIDLGSPYAPYHLAQIMLADPALTPDDRARAEALIRLAAERGFAPADDAPSASKGA